MNTTNRISNHLFQARIGLIFNWLITVVFLTIISNQHAMAQCLQVEKSILGVRPASSGVPGNINVTFQLTIINNSGSCAIATGVSINDTLNSASNFGAAFVGIVGTPVVAYVSPGSAMGTGNINPSFGSASPYLTDNTGFLILGDSIIFQFTAELDVDAVGAPAVLANTAWVSQSVPVSTGEVPSNTVVIPDCWSDCQLACNNQVQVSVNSICEADILADMILEGENGECARMGFYEVTIYYNNVKVNLPLSQFYLNKKLKVNVRNIVCNNSCWGNLVLEDKTPPALNCRLRDTISCAADISPAALGFPVPVGMVNQSVYPYIVTGIDACGVVYLTYSDSLVRYDCINDSLSATIYRKWCATDPGGYKACCYDTIDLRRGTLADITLPPHYDGLPGNNPMLKCDGAWTKFPNGNPDTTATGTGKPSGIYCGNIAYDFSDDTIRVCPGTFKLLRRWIILDWCNPTVRIDYIQQIKVIDDSGPAVTCPSNFTVNTNPWSCTGSLILPVPEDLTPTTIVNNQTPYVIENCSGWTYYVKHLAATNPNDCTPLPGQGTTQNITKLPDGRYRVDNMPLGCNWIYYVVTDGCGNSTVCQFDLQVIDKTPPVAVCQQKTVISVGSNGRATVPATVFDDHSHDNCGPVTFQVRRMNPGPCGTTVFQPTQEFCCDDVSATNSVRVVLRVIDAAGNSSECMVDAFVQDKIPPRITCPKNYTVSCTRDLSNLNVFGTATATDNCNVRIETRVINNLNACNLGTITREFIAIDNGNLRDSCRQIITVVDSTPFKSTDIVWPSDIVLNGCGDNPSTDITGKPIYLNKDVCNQPISTYEDLVFNFVDGVCYKILRKWTVIDWCTYNQINQTGIWYHTQVIMVNNTDAPTFTSSCQDQQHCITNGCSVNVFLEATAFDLCTPQQELRWSYALDLNNDGSINATGNSSRLSFTFDAGVHRITWKVKDQCGNESTCSYLINVKDCKRPTPYCLDGIITVLMQSTGSVTIWAKDFNLKSEDNCTSMPQLRYSFSPDVNDIYKILTCADIPNGRSDTVEITMYVTDNDGNQEFCKTKLILQDNQDVCPDVLTLGTLSGAIRGYNNNPSPEVTVAVKTAGNQQKVKNTNSQGTYAFDDLSMYKAYVIIPEYDKDVLTGVSTKDIVKIQRHILGIELFDTPYKAIAADVNKSGGITASDISELRKLILGIQTKFKSNQSWNFVDANYPATFDNFSAYPSTIAISEMNQSVLTNDFIAVKTGDVTGEANTGFSSGTIGRSKNQLLLEIEQAHYAAGEVAKIAMKNIGADVRVEGLQFALNLENQYFEILGVEPGVLNIQSDEYSLQADGSLKLSWNADDQLEIKTSEVVCYVICKVKSDVIVNANTLRLDMKSLNPEVYTDKEDLGISLIYRSEDSKSAGGFELYQNVPNPFYGETTIFFNVPKESFVKLALYDLSGKAIRSYDVNAKKGINSVLVKTDDIFSNGVLYYRLEADEYSSTKKMIILK